MAERKPEVGNLEITTFVSVTDYGACTKLEELEKPSVLNVFEISSSWIRNIRNVRRSI